MSVRLTDNSSRVKNTTEEGLGLAIRFMLEDIYAEATPHTPMKTGDLRARVLRTMEGNTKGIITWDSDYAGVQERGYRRGKNGIVHFRHYTTSNTGPHYASDAVEDIVERLPEYIEKADIL